AGYAALAAQATTLVGVDLPDTLHPGFRYVYPDQSTRLAGGRADLHTGGYHRIALLHSLAASPRPVAKPTLFMFVGACVRVHLALAGFDLQSSVHSDCAGAYDHLSDPAPQRFVFDDFADRLITASPGRALDGGSRSRAWRYAQRPGGTGQFFQRRGHI